MRRIMSGNGTNGVWEAAVLVSLILGMAMAGALWNGGGGAPLGRTPCPFQSPTSGLASIDSPRVLNPCPGWEWVKTYGTASWDESTSLAPTSDGGAVLLTYTTGPNGTGLGARSTVLRLDQNGTVLWQEQLPLAVGHGGSIKQTSDGGFVVAHPTNVFGSFDVLVYRLDALGQIAWQKTYGGSGIDWPSSIAQTSDGGYIIGADTTSFGAGGKDLWLLRLDPSGGVIWQKTVGGAGDDDLADMRPTADGGFVAVGQTTDSHSAAFVVRLDSGGNEVWQKTIQPGNNPGVIMSVAPTVDGGFVVHLGTGGKWYVTKLSGTGNIVWQKIYGDISGTGSIAPTADGGFVLSATVGSLGSLNLEVLRIDANGNRLWQRTYGGSLDDWSCHPQCIHEASDGNFLVAGYTKSFGAGDFDAWLLRLFTNGAISSSCTPGFGTSNNSPVVSNSKLKIAPATFASSSAAGISKVTTDTVRVGDHVVTTQCSA